MLGNDICLCIVGNKIDLEKDRHVSVEDAERYRACYCINIMLSLNNIHCCFVFKLAHHGLYSSDNGVYPIVCLMLTKNYIA